MPFIKGKSGNPKGRTPIAKGGKPNSIYGTRSWISELLENNRKKLEFELDKLEGKEFVTMYMKLIPYVVAQRNNQIIDIKNLSDREVNDILEAIN